ncbi:MAG: ankyrin repeat domain-containing protein [Bacteroidota bacterium]
MKLLIALSLCLSFWTAGFGQSELASIISRGDTTELQAFFAQGEDLNALHIQSRYTCLNFAVRTNQIEVVRWLLAQQADPNRMSNGKSALMYAAKYGRLDIAKLLIAKGADKNLRNDKQRTALDYARKYEQKAMYSFLKQT